MELHRFDDVATFYNRAEVYLLQHEAYHNLMLGLCGVLLDDPHRYGPLPPYVATVEENGELEAVVLMTPPHNLILSKMRSLEAAAVIAAALQRNAINVPGVHGPSLEAHRFAEAWKAATGHPYHKTMAMRIYQLEEVQPVPQAPGHLRLAIPADRDLLISWAKAFNVEALGSTETGNAPGVVDRLTAAGSLYLWDDEQPVSMVATTGPTPNGIRVNMVYTPLEHRKRGYATSLVAAVSQHLLEQGRRFVFLFTDLANPTSNHIYQQIGYRPICDVDTYAFNSPTN
jgi:uncharacterized protein